MGVTGELSDDARVHLLLCSSLALPRGEATRPLGPVTWSRVATALASSGTPAGSLLGLDVGEIEGVLGTAAAEPNRIARLLVRSGQLAFELERLAGRGIGVITLADDDYPSRLRERLGPEAPPVLFLAGDRSILDAGGVAIVGSRDVDPVSAAFAEAEAAAAAHAGVPVISGGARGVDQLAMRAAFEADGRVVGVLPEGLEPRLRDASTRTAVAAGAVVLLTPYHPAAGFSAGAAMGRNKLIYALSDLAVVVASAAGSGGTWAGAVEALKAGWVPVFVRHGEPVPPGNLQLIAMGGVPLDQPGALAAAAAGAEPSRIEPRIAEDRAAYEQPSLNLLD